MDVGRRRIITPRNAELGIANIQWPGAEALDLPSSYLTISSIPFTQLGLMNHRWSIFHRFSMGQTTLMIISYPEEVSRHQEIGRVCLYKIGSMAVETLVGCIDA